MLCLVAQSCLTLCDPMDCISSSVHGDSPGKSTGVGCHALLQEIFPTQGSNPGVLLCRWILYLLSHQETYFQRIHLHCRGPQFTSWIWKIHWRRDRLYTPVFLGFLCGSAGKVSTCNVGDLCLIRGLGRSPGEGKGYPLQYSGLENSMDCIVHGAAKSRTRLSNFHFHWWHSG